jgi:hypothetical protein
MRQIVVLPLIMLLYSCSGRSTENVETNGFDIAPIEERSEDAITFSKSLRFREDTVLVAAYGEGSIRKLRLECSDNHRYETDIDGEVTNAYYSDLDENGRPEIYVISISAGSGSYGNVFVCDQSDDGLREIRFPSPDMDNELFKGYMGHDSIFIRGNRLIRHFPVYRDGDANASPTGGNRQLSYRLKCNGDSCAFMVTAFQ